MKITRAGNKQIIKISKSEWEGLRKQAQVEDEMITEISALVAEEERYRMADQDILEMPEATPEDIDEGFGSAMSSQEFKNSLQPAFIQVMNRGNNDYKITFVGNYGPTSVNAGRTRRVFIGSVDQLGLDRFLEGIKDMDIPVSRN